MGNLLDKVKKGFGGLNVERKYKKSALKLLKLWLTDDQFPEYVPQIKHFIDSSYWEYLLDCFYQVIPFGTGGRRGEVGIGPNRINTWTIEASAQGHSQYLIKQYGDDAKKRGVVLAFGVREFFSNKFFDKNLTNPVKNLTGRDLAVSASKVYLANGVKVRMYETPRTTPELSFAIRYYKAVAGDMFDASHNPPEHNGKKVFDEHGGQLIPPEDEILVKEVTENTKEILCVDSKTIEQDDLLEFIGEDVDQAYIEEIKKLSYSTKRNQKIIFTPLHGVGSTSVLPALKQLGFDIEPDPKTNNQSGKFENVTFNIPNPEVIESFDTTLKYVKKKGADLLLSSDPDADRIGVMVHHKNKWRYLNGNEIGVILMDYAIQKRKPTLKEKGYVIKTSVTTNLATQICRANDIEIIGELPVGFKYIGDIMNKLEDEGKIDDFIFGLEESHGYIAGNYLRDKDAAIGAVWLAELASELKESGQTLVDYLDRIYSTYGYFRNYLTEIRMLGALGMGRINKTQDTLRKTRPEKFDRFKVSRVEDFWDRRPIVSETDRVSKNVLIFHITPVDDGISMKVTVRPSGTEPKIKMYFEIGNKPCKGKDLTGIKEKTEKLLGEFEKSFMLHCYKILNVKFPERGFLLFWQLPLDDKMKYFEMENEILELKKMEGVRARKRKLEEMLSFLGADPIEKIDKAFKAKYKLGVREYLSIL